MQGVQKRFNCWPNCVVIINGYVIPMSPDADGSNELKCELDGALLQDIIEHKEHWNNAELGCHIDFEREGPYMPDVHTLLCFFHV